MGWLALLLGGSGFLLCIALLIGVWVLAYRLDQGVSHLHEQLDAQLVKVDEGAENIRTRMVEARDAVNTLDHRLRTGAEDALAKAELDPEAVLALEQKLAQCMASIRHWVDLAQQGVTLTEGFIDAWSGVIPALKSKAPAWVAILLALEEFNSALEDTGPLVEEFQVLLKEFERQPKAVTLTQRYQTLHQQLNQLLGTLEGKVAAFVSGLQALREYAESFRVKVQREITRARRLRIQPNLIAGCIAVGLPYVFTQDGLPQNAIYI
jgi:hypothetical protein